MSEHELDWDLLLHYPYIEGSKLGEGGDLEGDVGMSGVGEQDYFVRFLIGATAQEGGRSEWMVRPAPADDLHAKNISIEFRQRRRICGA